MPILPLRTSLMADANSSSVYARFPSRFFLQWPDKFPGQCALVISL